MTLNLEECLKNNIHNRSEADIKKIISEWTNTPIHYIRLDYRSLFQSDGKKGSEKKIEEVQKADGSSGGSKESGNTTLDLVSDEDSQTHDVSVLSLHIIFSCDN